MTDLGTCKISKEFSEAIVKKIIDTIKANRQCLPCEFKDVNSDSFVVDVDAKIHLEIAGVCCDFEIHYPDKNFGKEAK
jgi:hypothetical protein